MTEKITSLEFDFGFLRNEPHSTMEEMFTLNGGVHLMNHLADHRKNPESNFYTEASELNMKEPEIRICISIIRKIEKTTRGSYRHLPQDILDEGRRQAMVVVEEMWKPIVDEIDRDPVIRANIKRAREEMDKMII